MNLKEPMINVAHFCLQKTMSAAGASAGKEIEISKVNPQQLQQLHQQLEQEIQNLQVSFTTLQTVNQKFKASLLMHNLNVRVRCRHRTQKDSVKSGLFFAHFP